MKRQLAFEEKAFLYKLVYTSLQCSPESEVQADTKNVHLGMWIRSWQADKGLTHAGYKA